MKSTLLLLFVLTITLSSAQDVNWMTMNEAFEAQKEDPKPIIVDMYTTWCGPCKIMDTKTLQNKHVSEFINENYYAVKFNAEGTEEVDYNDFTYTNPRYKESKKGKRNSQHLFPHALKINGYPSIVFFDENGQLIAPVVGYQSPTQLEIYLKMISNDDYKRLTTAEAWQDYRDNFEYTFAN